MQKMRSTINRDITMIRTGLSNSKNIDYYPKQAEFIAPYTLKVENETITSKMIFLKNVILLDRLKLGICDLMI